MNPLRANWDKSILVRSTRSRTSVLNSISPAPNAVPTTAINPPNRLGRSVFLIFDAFNMKATHHCSKVFQLEPHCGKVSSRHQRQSVANQAKRGVTCHVTLSQRQQRHLLTRNPLLTGRIPNMKGNPL